MLWLVPITWILSSFILETIETLPPNRRAWASCHFLGIWNNCWCAVTGVFFNTSASKIRTQQGNAVFTTHKEHASNLFFSRSCSTRTRIISRNLCCHACDLECAEGKLAYFLYPHIWIAMHERLFSNEIFYILMCFSFVVGYLNDLNSGYWYRH